MKATWCLIALFLLQTQLPVDGREFGPWDADVAVGDDLVEAPALPADARPAMLGGVYDSFTGGAIILIRAFQIWISPQDGPTCRLHPTCSAYGAMAVRKYGAFIGSVLAGDRILRCNLFSKPGHDPVPDNLFRNNR